MKIAESTTVMVLWITSNDVQLINVE